LKQQKESRLINKMTDKENQNLYMEDCSNDPRREPVQCLPLQITLEESGGDFSRMARNFKNAVLKSGVLKEYKQKSRWEKKSDKRRRKLKESENHRRSEAAKLARLLDGTFDRKMKEKEERKNKNLNSKDKSEEIDNIYNSKF